jgi:mRNA interferase RelE/StbE
MYRISYLKPARKALIKMPRNQAKLIRSKIELLATSPRAMSNNVTKLTERDGFRLRVGGWRVIYEVDHAETTIVVMDIGPRGSICQ